MKLLFLLLIIIYSNIVIGQSQWYWANPIPQGNELESIYFINESTGFMGGNALIKTTNGGANWVTAKQFVRDKINDIEFIDEQKGFAVGFNSSFLITTDGGNTWNESNVFPPSFILTSISFINNNTGFMSAYNSNGVIFKTTNGGANWQQNNIGSDHLHDIIFTDENTGYISGWAGKVYKSVDGGINWTITNTGNPVEYVSISFQNNLTGFVCGSNGGISRTTNGGLNWSNFSLGTLYLRSVQTFSNYVFVRGDGPVFWKSSNLGLTWDSTSFGEDKYGGSLFFLNSGTGYYCGSGGEIAKTINNGLNWEFKSHKLAINVSDLNSVFFTDANTGWAVGGYGIYPNEFTTILKTTNGGINWMIERFGYPSDTLVDIKQNKNIVAATGGVVMNSTDYGENWATLYNSDIREPAYVSIPDSTLVFLCTSEGKIMKSTPWGNNPFDFYRIRQLPGEPPLNCIQFLDSLNGYVAGDSGIIVKTTDGYSFQTLNTGHSDKILKMFFLDTDNGYLACENGKILKTTNGGSNWSTTIIGNHVFNDIQFLNYQTGYVSSVDRMFTTTNSGSTWNEVYVPTNSIRDFFWFDNKKAVLVGEKGKILVYGDINPFIQQISSLAPENYHLSQNYPNPFNPSTKIKFDIPKGSLVKLKIYDMLGREVATLVNEKLNPGSYEYEWNGMNLPSGVYFYKLESENFIETKRMVLVK